MMIPRLHHKESKGTRELYIARRWRDSLEAWEDPVDRWLKDDLPT